MKINKVFEILFVVFLIMSMVSAGSAAIVNYNTITSPTMGDVTTTVSYGAIQSYNLTLPQSVTFTSAEKSMTTTIKAEDVVLSEGKFLRITVLSKHNWKMFEHDGDVKGDAFIPYTMSFDGNTLAGDPTDITGANPSDPEEVLVVQSGDSGAVEVTFAFNEVPHTGEYRDTLTFNIDPAYILPTP